MKTLARISTTLPLLLAACSGDTSPNEVHAANLEGSGEADTEPSPYQQVAPGYFGARDRIYSVDGTPLAVGATPAEAAENFVREFAAALGLDAEDLRLDASRGVQSLQGDTRTSFPYQQVHNGVVVAGGGLRVLVDNTTNEVVWAANQLRSLGDFELPDEVELAAPDLDSAWEVIAAEHTHAQPVEWSDASTPVPVVYAGRTKTAGKARLAMQFEARSNGELWELTADASSGKVLEARPRTHHFIAGFVNGERIPLGGTPQCIGPQLEEVRMPHAKIGMTESGQVWTGHATGDGRYRIYWHPPQALIGTTLDGQYFYFEEGVQGPAPVLYDGSNPGISFLYEAQDSISAEQFTVYSALGEAREFVRGRASNFPALNDPVRIRTNVTDSGCEQGLVGSAGSDYVNFCAPTYAFNPLLQLGTNMADGALVDVAFHEYGHVLIENGTAGQADALLHETVADMFTLLMTDEPDFGVGLFTDWGCLPARSALNDCTLSDIPNHSSLQEVRQYLIDTPPHEQCSTQVVYVAAFWDLLQALHVSIGSTYKRHAADLLLNAILINSDGTLTGGFVLDLLMLDDDDANLGNGTPHSAEICSSFGARGIDCGL